MSLFSIFDYPTLRSINAAVYVFDLRAQLHRLLTTASSVRSVRCQEKTSTESIPQDSGLCNMDIEPQKQTFMNDSGPK